MASCDPEKSLAILRILRDKPIGLFSADFADLFFDYDGDNEYELNSLVIGTSVLRVGYSLPLK